MINNFSGISVSVTLSRGSEGGNLVEAFSDRERYSLLVLSLLALLLFFSPLLSIQVPMTGEQQVTGYDVVSRVNNIKQNLQSVGGEKEDTPPPQQRKSSPVELPKMPELPTSIKLAWIIPAAIIVAWVCAVVTILAPLLIPTSPGSEPQSGRAPLSGPLFT